MGNQRLTLIGQREKVLEIFLGSGNPKCDVFTPVNVDIFKNKNNPGLFDIIMQSLFYITFADSMLQSTVKKQ